MNDNTLQQLLQDEQDLQFTSFNERTAWEIGCQLVDQATRAGLSVTIDIVHGQRQLFHAALPGTSADNDDWIRRKVRTVHRFGHSSFYIGQLLKSKGKSIQEAYLVSEGEFAPHGGAFPVIVKDTGVVGVITVSGLPQEEDHKLVVQAIRAYLTKE